MHIKTDIEELREKHNDLAFQKKLRNIIKKLEFASDFTKKYVKIRLLIALVIFVFLLIFPTMYNLKIYLFFSDIYLQLAKFKTFNFITIITGIILIILYLENLRKLFFIKH